MRSGTPKRSSRATSGGGFCMKMSYCSKRCSKAISIESRKPSVTISAVLAPLRSMMALVASVVPWMIRLRSPGSSPASFRICSTPASTPSSGARGVVSTFTLSRLSVPFQRQVGESAADIDGQSCFVFGFFHVSYAAVCSMLPPR